MEAAQSVIRVRRGTVEVEVRGSEKFVREYSEEVLEKYLPGAGDLPATDDDETPSTGAELQRALEELLDGGEVTFEVLPSMGCNIKWKPGNEPIP